MTTERKANKEKRAGKRKQSQTGVVGFKERLREVRRAAAYVTRAELIYRALACDKLTPLQCSRHRRILPECPYEGVTNVPESPSSLATPTMAISTPSDVFNDVSARHELS